jgi:hypothetical protein
VDGTPGSNDMPGRILLRTTPDGSQAPVDAVKIDSAQNVTVSAGNLVIGTSGKGIDFSATPGTGTSELLADYEEGTWTPVVTPAGGSITSITIASATYTKIGRLVMATTRFTITDAGTGTGGLDITLPLTAGSQNSTGTAFESALTGDAGRAWVSTNATSMLVAKYNNVTYCVTNAVITATAIYSV